MQKVLSLVLAAVLASGGSAGAGALSQEAVIETTEQVYLCDIADCSQMSEHSHNICSESGCNQRGNHSHDGSFYYGHHESDGHGHDDGHSYGCHGRQGKKHH